MKLETIEKLCCPFDKQDLELKTILTDDRENIIEGWLTCGTCMRLYPIIKGIPIMNPDEYREGHLEQPVLDRWQKQLAGKEIKDFRLLDKASDNT
ncbi:Trm112 family protein [Algoriphagus sp. D3-2-R+10]|uniref:Trm112 family protein n=1 Tax=Algoriphagus aurantiacus TaxID=3103948 RepID=UPI002B3EF349|nr:Trm112 family protein [Algoriphagus sp. D3-2-R+10]MEB2773940.1 Trm112 family protein [Algoriphagus sp. D3-2-R+10]